MAASAAQTPAATAAHSNAHHDSTAALDAALGVALLRGRQRVRTLDEAMMWLIHFDQALTRRFGTPARDALLARLELLPVLG